RQRAAGGEPGQRGALDVLHAEVRLAVALADVVDRQDVWVVEPGRRAGLGPEAAYLLLRGQAAAQHDLQGDDPLEAGVAGPVDDAHAAAAQLLQQAVVAEVPGGDVLRRLRVGLGGRRPGARRRADGGFRPGHLLGELDGAPELPQLVG